MLENYYQTLITSFYASLLVLVVFCVIGGLVLVYWVRQILLNQRRLPSTFNRELLLVTVPQYLMDKNEKEQPKNFKELIGVVENFYANLGGLKAAGGSKAFWHGRHDHFSLEIVVDKEGLISFYISTPPELRQFLEQQLQAQFSNAQIEEVADYNIFNPKGVVVAATLGLQRSHIFPILTYDKIQNDPLNALTNSLSKLGGEDTAAIQIIARSAHKSWHKLSYKVASEMQQGKKLSAAVSAAQKSDLAKSLGKLWQDFFPAKKDSSPKDSYRLSPLEEEMVKLIEEKTSRAGFDVNIRLLASAPTAEKAEMILHNLANAFSQFAGYQYGNGFKVVIRGTNKGVIRDFIYRNFDQQNQFILNAAELAGLYHFPLPSTTTPNIRWLKARTLAPPQNLPTEGIILGDNYYRGVKTEIRMKLSDRRRHMYVIGGTGTGKSTLMEEMIKQDIAAGEGVCVIDPHGTLIDHILPCVPKERFEDIILFDASDTEWPIGLNMLEGDSPQEMDYVSQEMIAIFYKLVTDPSMIGPIFEHNMRNVMFTLMSDKEDPGTIADIPRMFTDPVFQKYKLTKVTDPMVRAFWEKEMAKTSDFHKSETLGYLISKVGRFVENTMMRNIIGQQKSGFNFREVMDQKKVLLVNLAKGVTGEINSQLLGLIIMSKLQMAALSRANVPEEERYDFFCYIDEFQNFITDSISVILAEARKYRLDMIMAHQYIGQLFGGTNVEGKAGSNKVKDAIFGNVGTLIAYRIGVDDSEIIAKQMAPVVNEYDLLNLPMYTSYIRLLIDNAGAPPFNMTHRPPSPGRPETVVALRELSRLKYGQPRAIIEQEILRRSQLGEVAKEAADIGRAEPTL
ncbi:MAG: type IV secretion system DNA-binding domain-containing protein [Candidatus Buchananbacteria bacterium]